MHHRFTVVTIAPIILLISALSAQAQTLSPDASLGTAVIPAGVLNGLPSDIVVRGTVKGSNLFHSFTDFGVATGKGVYFQNPAGISNIFTRVTGSGRSMIDGTLGVLGTANLFLLNPNGITFGPTAQLLTGGSLFAITASKISFGDGQDFLASASQPSALLSISVPIGLQYGPNPASVEVQGAGHNYVQTAMGPTRNGGFPKLTVAPGQTLALIGGTVNLDGADLFAPGGRVEVGAVGSDAFVGLTIVPTLFGPAVIPNYATIPQFGPVILANRSAIDVTAGGPIGAGTIQIQGKTVRIADGSLLISVNAGSLDAGKIQVNATEAVDLLGIGTDNFQTRIETTAIDRGRGSDIVISTQRLSQQGGGAIRSTSAGFGPGGNIAIRAADSVVINGDAPLPALANSSINTLTFGGLAGSISLDTPRLSVISGGAIVSAAFSSGTGGDVTINAKDVNVAGFNATSFSETVISSLGFGTGSAGNLLVNTDRLAIQNGGGIAGSAFGQGRGANVVVNATASVLVEGFFDSPRGGQRSTINASALAANPAVQQLLGVPPLPTGNAGSVTVTTPNLRLGEKGLIGARNEGSGNGGTTLINADRIVLSDRSEIVATTASGEGGNVVVNAQESLLLRRGASISTTAGGTGNGGNIALNAPFLVSVPIENSDIVAQAAQGRGGNIQITASDVYGITSRSALTPLSDINASSALGVSGIVTVVNQDVNPRDGQLALPSNLTDASQQISTGCGAKDGSQFVVTGQGGIPTSPIQTASMSIPWQDRRDRPIVAQSLAALPWLEAPWLEATGFRQSSEGRLQLVADVPAVIPTRLSSTCVTTTDRSPSYTAKNF
jgi:filamentous hemagglutinin family protein